MAKRTVDQNFADLYGLILEGMGEIIKAAEVNNTPACDIAEAQQAFLVSLLISIAKSTTRGEHKEWLKYIEKLFLETKQVIYKIH